MLDDKLLMWRFKAGSNQALRCIYEKYKDILLTLATALLANVADAEDVVHDVFVSFTQSPEKIRVNGSLKGYLTTCVANRARDKIRTRQRRQTINITETDPVCSSIDTPDLSAIQNEQMKELGYCFAELTHQQREVIILHLQGGMKFSQIARLQNASVNTIKSRYRYGLEKLRSLLISETQNETRK